jgi:hypothetical protein
MANYDFRSLSSFEFEQLTRDLLQQEFGIRLESFKTGRDGGIDLRYSASAKNDLIIQCKHFTDTPYKAFLRLLEREEAPKVKRLGPNRYILVTSKGLTPQNKEELGNLFHPFCQNSADIYGQDDLNNLLGLYPEIERRHFKLWLTSQTVLERILHSEVFAQTASDLEAIQHKLCRYVQNDSFGVALKLLNEHHYCIITGIPGIGKTTLAEALLGYFLGFEYTAYSITGDIAEALKVLNHNEKQIFYYDDFLGQTSLEEKLNKNEDRKLLSFIETVGKSTNTRFIMTTREYILNQAKLTYEKLAHSNFDVRRCIIDLASYTEFNRAQILYNHVYFSDLPQAYHEALVRDQNYWKIIKHHNFIPRIIEWMTDQTKILGIDSESFIPHCIASLDDPTRLWEHAFNYQLSDEARHLLLTLVSMPMEVFIVDLQVAFGSFYQQMAQEYGFATSSRDFEKALKELDGNFVRTEQRLSETGTRSTVRFHNPSIKDFLQNQLARTPDEAIALCMSAPFFQQVAILGQMGSRSGHLDANTLPAPSVRSVLAANPDLLMQQFVRTVFSDSCGVIAIRYSATPNEMYYRRSDYPVVLRLQHILRTLDKLFADQVVTRFGQLLDGIMDELLSYLQGGTDDKEFLAEFLVELKKRQINLGEREDEFLDVAKECLLSDMDSTNHHVAFADFANAYRELVSEADRERARDLFIECIDDEVDSIINEFNSPEEIRGFADSLKGAAAFHKIDVTSQVDYLIMAASELEQRIEDGEKEDIDAEYPRTTGLGHINDIDALFSTLNDRFKD